LVSTGGGEQREQKKGIHVTEPGRYTAVKGDKSKKKKAGGYTLTKEKAKVLQPWKTTPKRPRQGRGRSSLGGIVTKVGYRRGAPNKLLMVNV